MNSEEKKDFITNLNVEGSLEINIVQKNSILKKRNNEELISYTI